MINNYTFRETNMKWQIEYGKEIIEKCNNGIDTITLGKLYDIKPDNIRHFLRKHNGSNWRGRRKYTLSESYFEEINTPNKAYLLGFLCADGHVSERRASEGIQIEIQARDKEILEFYRRELETNKPIKDSIKMGQPYKRIRILSTKMRDDLNRLDIRHHKTQTLTFPRIVKELESHFIRGYFDGDGCIYIKEKHLAHSCASIIATPLMCETLKEIFSRELGITANIRAIRKGKRYLFAKTIHIEGGNQLEKFIDYIYNDASLYLTRKYKKCKQFKQYKREIKKQ